jgi:hypothetical protein
LFVVLDALAGPFDTGHMHACCFVVRVIGGMGFPIFHFLFFLVRWMSCVVGAALVVVVVVCH